MTNIAADYIHRGLGGLNRRPVLTVLIFLLVAFGVAVFAVWLGTSSGANSHKSELFYVAGATITQHNRESTCVNYT
jgi:hypothetical protein